MSFLEELNDRVTEIAARCQVKQPKSGFDSIFDRVLSLDERAFFPGQRTADKGSLGASDGIISLGPAALLTALGETELDVTLRLRRILACGHGPANEITTKLRANSPALTIFAFDGGAFELTLSAKNGAIEHKTQLLAPEWLFMDVDRVSLIAELTAAGVKADASEAHLDAILALARQTAAHILRPLNLRLIWPGDRTRPRHVETAARADNILPAHHAQSLACVSTPGAAVWAVKQLYLTGSAVTWETFDSKQSGHMLAPRLRSQIATLARALRDKPNGFGGSGWDYDATLHGYGLGQIKPRFGARPQQGSLREADQALAALIAANDLDSFVACAGRALGVQIAAGACRLLGLAENPSPALRTEDAAEAGVTTATDHPDESLNIPARNTTHTDLLDKAPQSVLRDLLGLHQPDGRAVGDLAADLKAQQTALEARPDTEQAQRALWTPLAGKWLDLCTLYRWYRNDPADCLTSLDVLAGLIADRSLDRAASLLMVPAPYNGHVFLEGDRDRDPYLAGDKPARTYQGVTEKSDGQGRYIPARYGGVEESARSGDGNLITCLQNDLTRVGLHWGHPQPGLYGYVRWAKPAAAGTVAAHWTGTRAASAVTVGESESANHIDLKNGHTALAVREFQITRRYPNVLMERLDATVTYADRLHTVKRGDNAPPALDEFSTVKLANPAINGRLNVADAIQLQRWRFGRRRNPLVIEFWQCDETTNQRDVLLTENAVGPHDYNSPTKAHRAFAIDRTGHWRDSRRRWRLGRLGGGGWRGPRADEAYYCVLPFNKQNAIGAMELTAQRKYLLRILSGVVTREAGGFFDGYNAWDNAVFSTPPFHPTITRGAGDVPGQMGGLINFLQRPPAHIVDACFSEESDDQAAQRLALKQALRRLWWTAYGQFGIGYGWTSNRSTTDWESYSSPTTVQGPSEGFAALPPFDTDTAVDSAGAALPNMGKSWVSGDNAAYKAQRALYQSYSQWFRTWPWVYRFIAPMREDPEQRYALLAFMADFAVRTFRRTDTLETVLRQSDWTASYILRALVRGTDRYNKILPALRTNKDAAHRVIRTAMDAADTDTTFPGEKSPNSDFGNFNDSALPSGTLVTAYETFRAELLEALNTDND